MRDAWVTLRFTSAQGASGRRRPGRCPGAGRRRPRPSRPRVTFLLRIRSCSTSCIDASISLTKAVPRSKLKVTMATRQPSFSSPTRLATGTRTSSKNLAELLGAGDAAQRADVDAGRVHGQDQPADALVLGGLGVGADEELAVVGDLGVRTSRSSSR